MSSPPAPRIAPNETGDSLAHGASRARAATGGEVWGEGRKRRFSARGGLPAISLKFLMSPRPALLAALAAWVGLSVAFNGFAAPQPADPSSRPPLLTVPAPGPEAPTAIRFDGGHVGPLLGFAIGVADRVAAPPGQVGWDLRLGLRYATLLQLFDLSLWCEFGAHPAEPDQAIDRQALGMQVNLHPLFWVLVWDNFAGWVAAGLHGYAATALARVELQGPALVGAAGGLGASATHWAMQPEVGLGVDLPLSGRGGASGLWLTLRCGLRWLSVGAEPSHRLDLGDQHLTLAIGWRSYGALSSSPAALRSGGPSNSAGLGMRRSKSSQIRASFLQ